MRPPNILVIVADDLGYSDLGAFGSEIHTPNLDTLANDGLRLTNFHTAATCSPTRAMLLSGADNHPVGLATMPGHASANQKGKSGYEMHFHKRAFSIAELLRTGGYNTYLSGKWHLGGKPDQQPVARGFERSFALLEGGASHFDDAFGPTSKFPKAHYVEDGVPVDKLPADFYSSDYYTDKLIEYIDAGRSGEQPFFGVLAYTAPHWPLQAPEDYIDKYRGVYDQGYEQIAEQRSKNMRRLNLVDDRHQPNWGSFDVWHSFTAEQQRTESRKMEIYAAMVEHMDANVGRLMAYLKSTNAYNDTLIVFLSDNGPEGGNPLNLHNNKVWVPKNFDNRYQNMGRRGSYISYGSNWGRVSATPHNGYKAFAYEGGIRAPAIIHYPNGSLRTGTDDQFVSVKDLAPTLLDLTGLNDLTQDVADKIPMTGSSMLPFLTGAADQVHPENYAMGWEILGRYGVRKGDWKAVHDIEGEWQLFNLESDPSESHDLFDERPKKTKELMVEWSRYVQQNGVVLPSENVAY